MYNDAYADAPPAASTSPHETYAAVPIDEIRRVFPTARALAGRLDHTLLKPEATEAQALALAAEASAHAFACAMVNPIFVPAVHRALAGTGVRVGTVLAFPLGASPPESTRAEARATAQAGALDLDMVLPIGLLRAGRFADLRVHLQGVAEIAHGAGAILKVILETCLLTDEEKQAAAELCVEAGADFVKTSTGFSTGGATVADVQLLRRTVGDRCGVKASGGIRTLQNAFQMVAAGADRLGASASVSIVRSYLAACGNASGSS